MIGISFIRTQIRSLAEDLSISFLRLSTITSVKKTEMVQNRTFPDLNRMNDETKVTTFPLTVVNCR